MHGCVSVCTNIILLSGWEGVPLHERWMNSMHQRDYMMPVLCKKQTKKGKQRAFYLILWELGGLSQIHIVHLGWGVPGGQCQAAQCVPARPVLPDRGQHFVLDGLAERNLIVAHTHVRAPVDHAFRCPLWVIENRFLAIWPLLFSSGDPE